MAKELANLRKLKDHEAAVLQREKEELSKNHNLVMSERDNVHKEIEMLTERISSANSKVCKKSPACVLLLGMSVGIFVDLNFDCSFNCTIEAPNLLTNYSIQAHLTITIGSCILM